MALDGILLVSTDSFFFKNVTVTTRGSSLVYGMVIGEENEL